MSKLLRIAALSAALALLAGPGAPAGGQGADATPVATPPTAPTPTASAPVGVPLSQPDPAFRRIWGRTDGVVAIGQADRPWVWGPSPLSTTRERYGAGARQVQYYDKARMEVTNPAQPADAPGHVSNGRLVVELISGQVEVGEGLVQYGAAAEVPVAGDEWATSAPTYASFRFVASLARDRQVPMRLGQPLTETISRDGVIGQNPHVGGLTAVTAYSLGTGHNIPDVFADYLAGRGPISDGFQTMEGGLIDAPSTVGEPLTEAYWTQAPVGGQPTDVLVQLFERRTLTYWPSRPPGWQVEFGDAGRHYLRWRYQAGIPRGQAAQHREFSLAVVGLGRAAVETGPLPTPPPAAEPTATPRPGRGRDGATPTPAPTPTLPPGAVTTAGAFIVAELEVSNIGPLASRQGVGPLILVDDLGRQFEPSPEVTALAARRLGLATDQAIIRPGFTVRLVRAWEVAGDARGLMIVPAYGEKPALLVEP